MELGSGEVDILARGLISGGLVVLDVYPSPKEVIRYQHSRA